MKESGFSGEDKNHPVMPELIPWATFNEIEYPKERWLINNLLPLEGIVIIASPSGEKKTWIALHMADCIASGKNFLGNSEFKVQRSKVLYLDQEMSRGELQRRGKLLGVTADSEDLIIPKDLQHIDLSQEEYSDWLYEQIVEFDIRVLFVDTLRAVAGGLKEDKAEDVRAFFNEFMSLKKLGLCIVFLDHCRKSHPFEGKTPKKEQLLGSQDKVASIETLLMLKSDERTSEIKIYPKKSRTGVEFKPFSVLMRSKFDDDFIEIGIDLIYGGGLEETEYKSDEARELIMAFLSDGSKTTKQIVEYLGAENKVGQSNTRLALKELTAGKKITLDRSGREHLYTLKSTPNDSLLDS